MLLPRQQSFVEHYSICKNGTEAARRAGYSARSAKVAAARLLTNDNVLTELRRIQAQSAKNFELRRQDVVAGILKAIQLAVDQENPLAQITGWRELAKMLGFYEPEKRSISLFGDAQNLRTKYEELSTDELLKIISGQSKSLAEAAEPSIKV